jgi:hypothetical protein
MLDHVVANHDIEATVIEREPNVFDPLEVVAVQKYTLIDNING